MSFYKMSTLAGNANRDFFFLLNSKNNMYFFIALTEINWGKQIFLTKLPGLPINSAPFFQFKFTYYKSKSNM
jgi:hypothetical protein